MAVPAGLHASLAAQSAQVLPAGRRRPVWLVQARVPGKRRLSRQKQGVTPSAWKPQSAAFTHDWQAFPTHSAFAQSFRLLQVLPLAQRGQVPPQSTSVSLPFFIPSLQVGPDGGF